MIASFYGDCVHLLDIIGEGKKDISGFVLDIAIVATDKDLYELDPVFNATINLGMSMGRDGQGSGKPPISLCR